MRGIKGIAEKVMKLSHPVGVSIEQGCSLGRKMQPTNLFKEPFGACFIFSEGNTQILLPLQFPHLEPDLARALSWPLQRRYNLENVK